MSHIPVLLNEVINYLNCRVAKQTFIDGTLGGGGHSLAIIKKIYPLGKLLALDLDKDNIDNFQQIINKLPYKKNVLLFNDNFVHLKKIIYSLNLPPVKGILLDLGLSSMLLEDSGRGFSFQRDEPLDMRYCNPPIKGSLTATDIINTWSVSELDRIFWQYGEETNHQRIASVIVKARLIKKIETTQQLVHLINQIIPVTRKNIHPATKIFQALRIAVNQELINLTEVLKQSMDVLSPQGRLAVISYHSLEDRIVKRFFIQQNKLRRIRILTKKPIRPGKEEIQYNFRSRSGKLRVMEKI